jgi:mannitol/fructose-specific phosphotransferase system IIA component (Ntr-type)
VLVIPGQPAKHHVLSALIALTTDHPAIGDRAAFAHAIHDREEVTSTGIGSGVAVPHARLPSVGGFVLSIGLIPAGVDFAAQDRKPVYIVVMMAATDQERQTYLRVLAAIAGRLKAATTLPAMLAAAGDPDRVVAAFLGR